MGYLFLSLALLAGLTKGFCGKKTSGFASSVQSAAFLNLIRMLLCILFSFAALLCIGKLDSLASSPSVLGISALSGISTAAFVVTWLLSVRKNAYMMVDVFLMLGTLVPIVLSAVWFSDPVSVRQWIGFAVLLFAVSIMCSYSSSIKERISPSSLLLLIAMGAANGLTSFSQKLFVSMSGATPIATFNLYTYVFAAIALGIYYLATSGREKLAFSKSGGSRTVYLYVAIMAAALTAHSYFSTTAALYLDPVKLYPLNQGMGLILSTIMATLVFGEKLKIRAVLGILLSFAALMVINL
jgi:drug/metabolite transporter (DMT)-like permease